MFFKTDKQFSHFAGILSIARIIYYLEKSLLFNG